MENLTKELTIIKIGRWCISPDGWYPYCSECLEEPKDGIRSAFCPSCGVKMTDTD